MMATSSGKWEERSLSLVQLFIQQFLVRFDAFKHSEVLRRGKLAFHQKKETIVDFLRKREGT